MNPFWAGIAAFVVIGAILSVFATWIVIIWITIDNGLSSEVLGYWILLLIVTGFIAYPIIKSIHEERLAHREWIARCEREEKDKK